MIGGVGLGVNFIFSCYLESTPPGGWPDMLWVWFIFYARSNPYKKSMPSVNTTSSNRDLYSEDASGAINRVVRSMYIVCSPSRVSP